VAILPPGRWEFFRVTFGRSPNKNPRKKQMIHRRVRFWILLALIVLVSPAISILAQTQTPNLGLTKPSVGSLNWGPTVNTDLDLVDAKLAAAYYYQASAGSGLNLNIAAGSAFCGNPPVAVSYAGGTLALTASQTNYVYLDPAATCVPAFNITGFAVGQIPLAKVVTGASTITSVTDVRTWFVDPNSSGPVIRADLMPGADAGAKITAAIAALPATGGTVDARGLEGAQTISQNIFSGVTKPVRLLLGAAVYQMTAGMTIAAANTTIEGLGSGRTAAGTGATILRWTDGASIPVTISAQNTTLRGFTLDNTGTGTTGIFVNGVFYTLLDAVTIWPSTPFSIAAIRTASDAQNADLTLRRCLIREAAPIGADIDRVNLFVSDNSLFIFNNTNIRVGQNATVFGFYFVNGSNAELEEANGASAINIDFVKATNSVIHDSYFETAEMGTPGTEGQLAIRFGDQTRQAETTGNYFTGNGATNYAISYGSVNVTNVRVAGNTFTGFLTAALDLNGNSGELGLNYLTGGTPALYTDATPADHVFVNAQGQYIVNAKEIGIGTLSPQAGAALHAYNTTAASLLMLSELNQSGNPSFSFLQARNLGGTTKPDFDMGLEVAAAASLSFRTAVGGASLTEKLRLALDSGLLSGKRFSGNLATPLAAGDFALSAGWGTTASVGSIRGVDQWHEFVVTSAGTGQAANPTVTLTYKDLTWTTAPIVRCSRQEFASQLTATFSVTTQTGTAYVLTFSGTPAAAETYRIACFVGGI
jgi:hypothetical protein